MSLRLLQVDNDPGAPFPPVDQALAEPDGLLAFGGDLSPQRLLNAYRHGIFPWFSNGEPILWWSPSRRAVFRTDGVHLSSRFRRAPAVASARSCARSCRSPRSSHAPVGSRAVPARNVR